METNRVGIILTDALRGLLQNDNDQSDRPAEEPTRSGDGEEGEGEDDGGDIEMSSREFGVRPNTFSYDDGEDVVVKKNGKRQEFKIDNLNTIKACGFLIFSSALSRT